MHISFFGVGRKLYIVYISLVAKRKLAIATVLTWLEGRIVMAKPQEGAVGVVVVTLEEWKNGLGSRESKEMGVEPLMRIFLRYTYEIKPYTKHLISSQSVKFCHKGYKNYNHVVCNLSRLAFFIQHNFLSPQVFVT